MESFEKPDSRGRAFVNTTEKPGPRGRAFVNAMEKPGQEAESSCTPWKARPKRQSLHEHHVKPDVRGRAFVNTMDKPGLSSWGGPTWGQPEANLG